MSGNVLTLDYQANQSGTATITVTGTSNSQTVSDVFTVTVAAVDDAPVVANAISDLSAAEDAADATIDLANLFNDLDDDNASITKTATSSNASLVTATVSGNVLTLDYQANQSGTATITVTGTSNSQTVSDTFEVTVSPVDDAPVVANAIADRSAAEDAADATIDLANLFNDLDDDNASITKTATSSNASLVTATVSGNVLTLDYQANQSGTATITVTGTSNGQTVSDAFEVTVSPVDDAPENLSLSGNEVIENKPSGTIVGSLSATDVDVNATLAFSLVDGNGSADNARFTLNASGTLKTSDSLDFEVGNSLSIRVRVTDNNDASKEKAFTISVSNVVEDLDGDAIEDAFDTDDDGDGFSDAEEVTYGSDPMDASSVANQAPSGIALDNSDLIENSPAGTKIGDFLVSDPDDPVDSGAYVVALVAGNGSTDNNFFTIGTDGSLQTAAVLDFETKTEHSIRVRVSDEHNASLEAVLAIRATNSFAPIVRTLPPAVDGNGTITLGGTVLTDGGSPVIEVGVLTSDNLRFESAVSLAASQSANFTVRPAPSALLPGARYYVRSFATNAEGTTFGAIKRFYTQEAESTPAPWWSDANESAGGWRNSDWFGTFIPYDNGWLYHADIEWLYAIDDGTSGLWVWKENLGWLWTAKGAFPHLYRNDTKEWLYFLTTKEGKPYFYNHATGAVE
ncbi:MAG: cadherin domain-containing protein [Verrucomicrobia bacterium]|nr:cadherin domain-containing protein [Verrucomicrobiota bacterium]